ncbi:nitroreductase family deazaflavin-dependent oxidoreductase [Streptomyces brasiliscabiei]|uniref:Nitroreductase family deazaflavin-dependent oxidoreductase n=1 Tax=Streptomyces brasiliscabiei TaxID=2736302 RepID=A0ABU8GUZ4_9ACTN
MTTHQGSAPHRPRRPAGWRRVPLRLPILLFKAGLAPLFGKRLLLLHHIGRVSGLDRRTVLEVVAYDSECGSWTVAAGFGPASDWYQNLRRRPHTVVQFGNRHHTVTAHFLPPEAGAEIMADYSRRHPRTARRLCAFMGLPSDGSETAFLTAGRTIPFVRLDASDGYRQVPVP